MIFRFFRKKERYQNQFLENYYTPHYYDTYFKDKVGLKTNQLFKEHYNNFKPTLDNIQSFDKTKLTNPEIRNSYGSDFVKADLKGLFETGNHPNSRIDYLREMEPGFKNLSKYDEYLNIVNKFNVPSDTIEKLTVYYKTETNLLNIKAYIQKGQLYRYNFEKLPEFEETKSLLSSVLKNLDSEELNVLSYYIQNYEKFTVITLEPYMVSLLGFRLFFTIFVPIHQMGGFRFLVNEAILKSQEMNNTFKNRIVNFSNYSINSLSRFNQKWLPINTVSQVTLGCGFTGLAIGFFNGFNRLPQSANEKEPSVLVQSIVKKTILAGEGLNSVYVNNFKLFVYRISYEIGSLAGSVLTGIIQGAASRHEGVIETAAKTADKILDKKNK